MLTPFDNTMNLFLTAVPVYEWEPVAAPENPCGETAPSASDASGDGTYGNASSLPPPMQLVFKGVRWVSVPVWTTRENHAWEQIAQDARDDDKRNNLERLRQARRQPEGADATDAAPGTAETASPTATDGSASK